MEQMTFHFDTVLSDVHMHFHSAQHLMTRLNQVGQPGTPQEPSADDGGRQLVCPVILTQSHSALEPEEEDEEEEPSPTDKHIIRIGALLLADFILSQPIMFRAATVLDMGAGTGLTSIVMATTAKTVYCTDVGEDLLSMCRKNVSLNQHLMEDADLEFSWTEDEVADLHDNTSFIIAADGELYETQRIQSNTSIKSAASLQMNFTLRHMDVSCDAYNHFRHCLSGLQELEDQRCSFTVEQISANFTQFFIYERIEHLLPLFSVER
uniref:Methyltransferase like 22 n=1 Tax=Gouania willdenowi TaxID=441366 RepID=A0A8C5GD45_GOUWI